MPQHYFRLSSCAWADKGIQRIRGVQVVARYIWMWTNTLRTCSDRHNSGVLDARPIRKCSLIIDIIDSPINGCSTEAARSVPTVLLTKHTIMDRSTQSIYPMKYITGSYAVYAGSSLPFPSRDRQSQSVESAHCYGVRTLWMSTQTTIGDTI